MIHLVWFVVNFCILIDDDMLTVHLKKKTFNANPFQPVQIKRRFHWNFFNIKKTS